MKLKLIGVTLATLTSLAAVLVFFLVIKAVHEVVSKWIYDMLASIGIVDVWANMTIIIVGLVLLIALGYPIAKIVKKIT